MKKKTRLVIDTILARMGEQSTWQGIGFFVGLFFGKYGANLDWGAAAGLGGSISAVVKCILPEQK